MYIGALGFFEQTGIKLYCIGKIKSYIFAVIILLSSGSGVPPQASFKESVILRIAQDQNLGHCKVNSTKILLGTLKYEVLIVPA